MRGGHTCPQHAKHFLPRARESCASHAYQRISLVPWVVAADFSEVDWRETEEIDYIVYQHSGNAKHRQPTPNHCEGWWEEGYKHPSLSTQ